MAAQGPTISTQVKGCLELNRDLIQSLKTPQIELPDGVQLSLNDQKDRFAVWCGNIGAHRTGTSSLEYRLRDASHIKDNVIDLLGELEGLINDAKEIIDGEMTPWDEMPEDEEIGEDGDGQEEDIASTELEQIAMDIKEVVDSLLRLNMSIKNPAPHDRFFSSSSTDTSHFEAFDIQHVQSKYGEVVSPWLAERLGKAISRRRQYFKYRQEHHDKLAYGIGGEGDEHGVAPSTLASSIPEKLKKGHLGLIDDDDNSDAGRMSQTSFATSVAAAERLHVPPLPSAAAEGPFECPFCFMIVSITDRTAWKKHVFGDLRPYVCLERNCMKSDQEFGRRHEWLEHMKQNHWTRYACPFECGKRNFHSAAECKAHVESQHPGQVQDYQMDALIKLHTEDASSAIDPTCSFCGEDFTSISAFQKHVGRHQEQLSLFALPSIDADDEGESNDEDAGKEDASSQTHGAKGRSRVVDESRDSSSERALSKTSDDTESGPVHVSRYDDDPAKASGREVPVPNQQSGDNVNLGADSSDSEDEEEDFQRRREELRRLRRISRAGAGGKRTYTEQSESEDDYDSDVNDIGASKRMRRGRRGRASLIFSDPPERIEDLDEPSSSEDQLQRRNIGLQERKRHEQQETSTQDQPGAAFTTYEDRTPHPRSEWTEKMQQKREETAAIEEMVRLARLGSKHDDRQEGWRERILDERKKHEELFLSAQEADDFDKAYSSGENTATGEQRRPVPEVIVTQEAEIPPRTRPQSASASASASASRDAEPRHEESGLSFDQNWSRSVLDRERTREEGSQSKLSKLKLKFSSASALRASLEEDERIRKRVELQRLQDEETETEKKGREEKVAEAVKRYKEDEARRLAEETARELEYRRRLEKDLADSGLDEKAIAAILQKEKLKANEPREETSR